MNDQTHIGFEEKTQAGLPLAPRLSITNPPLGLIEAKVFASRSYAFRKLEGIDALNHRDRSRRIAIYLSVLMTNKSWDLIALHFKMTEKRVQKIAVSFIKYAGKREHFRGWIERLGHKIEMAREREIARYIARTAEQAELKDALR